MKKAFLTTALVFAVIFAIGAIGVWGTDFIDFLASLGPQY